MKRLLAEVSNRLVNRQEIVNQTGLAMLAGQHVLLKGPPGIGKSMLASLLLGGIKGASVFKIQLARDMSPDYIFGPMNLQKYRTQAIVEHNTQGSLVDCHFGFLDELFDAHPGLLRSILEVLNERTFSRNTGHVQRCPLISVLATTNYYKPELATDAVMDRFLVRMEVNGQMSQADQVKMFQQSMDKKPMKRMSFKQFRAARDSVKKVHVSTFTLSYVAEFLDSCQDAYSVISPRRRVWCLDLMKAHAWLRGDNVVTAIDLAALCWAIVPMGGNPADFWKKLENVSKKMGAEDAIYNNVRAAENLLGKFRRAFTRKKADPRWLTEVSQNLLRLDAYYTGLATKSLGPELDERVKGIADTIETLRGQATDALRERATDGDSGRTDHTGRTKGGGRTRRSVRRGRFFVS